MTNYWKLRVRLIWMAEKADHEGFSGLFVLFMREYLYAAVELDRRLQLDLFELG